MLLWFVGSAVLAVWYVFRDDRFDYRLLVVGALLPELDALFALGDGPGMRWLHSVTFSVALLVVVMVVTAGRRPIRRLLLGLPIGTFLHLVFDGAWTNTDVFWWPFGGWRLDGAALPAVQRGWWNIPLELVGLAIVVWVWRREGLADGARRDEVMRTGRLFAARPAPAGRSAPR